MNSKGFQYEYIDVELIMSAMTKDERVEFKRRLGEAYLESRKEKGALA